MSNFTVNAVYIPAAALCLIIAWRAFRTRAGMRTGLCVIFLSFSLFGWLLIKILYYCALDPTVAFWLYDLNLPFVALSAMATFLLACCFYVPEMSYPVPAILLLAILPFYTAVMAVTPYLQHYLRSGLSILATTPMHIASGSRGMWFWVHTAYCYALVAATLIMALVLHRRIPVTHRPSSRIIIIGILCSIVSNASVLSGLLSFAFDVTPLFWTAALVMVYHATRDTGDLVFVANAQSDIYHCLDSALLTLDDEGFITNRNHMAYLLLTKAGVNPAEASFPVMEKQFAARAHQIQTPTGAERSTDYYFRTGQGDLVLNIRENPIYDNRRNPLGRFIICRDVTDDRALIQRLEDVAGADALTGLANRRRMEREKQELDHPDNLPLAAIMGDLNNLKTVNDTLGHMQGDVLLRAAADALLEKCPPSARIGRVGGDEFLILIPNFTQENADALLASIRGKMQSLTEYPFTVQMALGVCVKEHPNQCLSEILHLADQHMYADKQNAKTTAAGRIAGAV